MEVSDDGTGRMRTYLTAEGEGSIRQWFLLTGKRVHVISVLLVAVIAALVALGVVRPIDLRALLSNTNTVQSMFNTLLSGIILLVSIVVSINSVILSQEITDIENQRDRIDASLQYRERLEEFIPANVSPASPGEFLRIILQTIHRQARALAELAEESSDEEFREQAAAFADEVVGEAERAGEILDGSEFGTFTVLFAGLNYNYSWQLNAARRFEREYADTLSDDELEAIEGLIETLRFFATGREYFKSLYFERDLARLSSMLLYVSLPAIVFTTYVLLALDTNLFPAVTFLGLSPLLVFLSTAYTIALAPYIVLTAYVLRATTVALRTLAAGPFMLQNDRNGSEEFEWEPSLSEISWDEWDVTDDRLRSQTDD